MTIDNMKGSNLQWNKDIVTTPTEDGFYVNNKTKEICKAAPMNQNTTAMHYLKKAFETAKENDSVQEEYDNMISKYARKLSEALDTNDYESETTFTKISFHDARKEVSNPNYGHPIEGLSPDEIKGMSTLLCRIAIQTPWIKSPIFNSTQTSDIQSCFANAKIRTDVFDRMKLLGYINEWAFGPNEELIFERIIPNPYYYDEFRGHSSISFKFREIAEEK